LASFLAQNNLAAVLTPDFRGHGKSRAEVAQGTHPESLLQDLRDLLRLLETLYPGKELWLGGHSLGGGFALKAMAHAGVKEYFQGAVALSPYLRFLFDAGEERFSSWLRFSAEKNIFELQMPAGYQSGNEVLAYDVKYFEAASPTETDVAEVVKNCPHLAVIASTGDLLSPAARYEKIFPGPGAPLSLLNGYSHMGQVMSPKALEDIAGILRTRLLWA